MNIDYHVYKYDYNLRDGCLDAEAKGEVKSKKYFPYFYENGKKIIFKPLSKTKPLSTPYFAYSELIWSHLLHTFFDSSIPLYHLATCEGYEEDIPKYHNYGTIVESVIDKSEKLVNIYEYFMQYPDAAVTPKIEKYINYCLVYYDYTFFFESSFFQNNPEIASEISRQILYSILRGDQNYHYENISLIYQGDTLTKVAPPIDHEFSDIFLYLDQEISHLNIHGKQIRELLLDRTHLLNDEAKKIITLFDEDTKKMWLSSKTINNIEVITRLYPEVIDNFIVSLEKMISYIQTHPIVLEDHNYLEPFSSDEFQVGTLRYKKNEEDKARELESTIDRRNVSVEEVNQFINNEIYDNADMLKKTLENKLSMI